MHYSIILASLAALAIAAPVEMKDMNNMNNMKQAADVEYTVYGSYGDYSNYGTYDTYPGGVEEAAKMIASVNRKPDMMMDATRNDRMIPTKRAANMGHSAMSSDMKHNMMMKNAMQAADTSYGKYGAYGKYSDYGNYPGEVEDEGAKTNMAKMEMGMTQ